MIGLSWMIGLTLALQVPPPQAAAEESAGLRAERQAIRDREAGRLKALAGRLEAGGKRAEAGEVLGRIEPAPPVEGPSRFVPLPEVVPSRERSGSPSRGLANVPAQGPTAATPGELGAIRREAAGRLFDLAVRGLSGTTKHYALADDCLRAVLDRDPDHAEARRLLGYVPHDGGWATPYAIQQIGKRKVDHPKYGWVHATWVPHLERGELPAPGSTNPEKVRWLPVAEADALRDTIQRGWGISTEHFQIQTDVPLSEAIAFGRKLEAFHDLFFSRMADVIAEDLPLARRFRDKAKATPRPPTPHTVYYFADKEEYVRYLQPTKGAEIAKTLGFYHPTRGKPNRANAYFFRDPGGQLDVTATLFHEVSHQLLFESTTAVKPSAYLQNVGNYWVFEGLGTYFETVTPREDGSLQVGGFVSPRIEVARQRLVNRGEHVPIAQLVRLGENGFNSPELIHLHYAEAMALTVLLMDDQDGRYREDYLDYVRDAFRGRLRGNLGGRPLEDRLGVAYDALDTELLAALKAKP